MINAFQIAIATGLMAAVVNVSVAANYGKATEVAKLKDEQIDESSGLAIGRHVRSSGSRVFWTHNDSGDGPRLFAFNDKGETLATVEIEGAVARDWEDMASFVVGGKPYLLIGDVGDNDRRRKHCALYIVPEPELNTRQRGVKTKVAVAQTIYYTYEGGRRDCEAVAIDVEEKAIYLITKEFSSRGGVYRIAVPKKPSSQPVVALRMGEVKIPMATGMDISADGSRAIVINYAIGYEYKREKGQSWAVVFAGKPTLVSLPGRGQGESVCYGISGAVYATSEGKTPPLFELPVLKETPRDPKSD